MELKNFKINDTIIQKNDPNIKWVVEEINMEENIVKLRRKGGYFNDMVSLFNGDNINFNAASKTEKRIKRENKISERKTAQENYQNSKKNKHLIEEDKDEIIEKKLKPKDVAELAACSIKDVLNAIHNQKLNAEKNRNTEGRGVRYLINFLDAKKWAEEFKAEKN